MLADEPAGWHEPPFFRSPKNLNLNFINLHLWTSPHPVGGTGGTGDRPKIYDWSFAKKNSLRFVTWSDSTIQLTQGSPQSQCEDDEVPPLTNCKTFFNKTEVSGFSCQKEHTPGANRWNPKNHLRWKGKSSSKNLHFLGSMFIFRVYFQQFRWWKKQKHVAGGVCGGCSSYCNGSSTLCHRLADAQLNGFFGRNSANNAADFCHFLFMIHLYDSFY